jgi:DNA replication and repair protein RecF
MLISIVLANARALKLELGYPPVILLDEISAHLDTDRRGALYEEIDALGAQAWMTGTDQNLFYEFGFKAKYFHVIQSSGISDIREVDFSVD